MRPTMIVKGLGGLVLLLLLSPAVAGAMDLGWFQWGTEGSYVHQVSHLLFLGAMIFLLMELRRGGLVQQRGFRRLAWACVFLALWNLEAVVGHAVEWSLLNPVILGAGARRRLLMEDWHTWLYYLTKLNHALLLVPGVYLIHRGLKSIVASSPGREA